MDPSLQEDRGPLRGRRVLVLRPRERAEDLARGLRRAGAEPVIVPAVEILPPPAPEDLVGALRRLGEFDWLVFTSPSGVAAVFEAARNTGMEDEVNRAVGGTSPRVAAVGPATTAALEARGIQVSFVPGAFTTAALAEELPAEGAGGGRVMAFRAAIAGEHLEQILRRRGFEVERVDAYTSRSADLAAIAGAFEGTIDAVALTSASIARALHEAFDPLPELTVVVAIGPATESECRRLGIRVDAVADIHTAGGLISALEELFAGTS